MSAIVYAEIHTTPANFVADVRAAIDASADWALVPAYREPLTTLAAAYAAGVTSIGTALANETDVAHLIGSRIVLGPGTANEEIVTITNMTTSAFTITATALSHASGDAVHILHENVLRAVTPAGTPLTLGLHGANGTRCGVTTWRTHNGTTTGTDPLSGFLRWFSAAQTATTVPVHVDVAAGPDFLWVSVEGPRVGEAGLETNGPHRTTLYLGTIVPYDDADTSEPVLATVQITDGAGHGPQVYVSRDAANTTSWLPARLLTVVGVVGANAGGTVIEEQAYGSNSTRGSTRFFWPWIVSEDRDGPRGRVKRIFFGGLDRLGPNVAGQRWTYNGLTYLSAAANDAAATRSDPWTTYAGANTPRPLVLLPIAGTP